MVLLCFADIHGHGAGLKEIADASPEADAIVIAGDVTHLGGYAEAEKILAPLLDAGKPVLAVRGNMDREGVDRWLSERGWNLHGAGRVVGDVGFHGLGGGPHSPFSTPFELAGADARHLLDQGHEQIASRNLRVLISHAPPKDTKLDRTIMGLHVGSPEVRALLEEKKPALCICGHIHESPGEDAIGETLCVNLGPYKSGRYAIINIDTPITVTWRNT
jgi:Icc-related predicted phosphoesterase